MSQYNRHLCMDGVQASPDLAARRLVMAALIYYQFNANIMTDQEYDALAVFVKDNWEAVSPTIQFCIGAEWPIDDGLTGWTSSGYSFKITSRIHHGALSWAEHIGLGLDAAPPFTMVDFDMETGVEYAPVRS